MLKRSGKSSYNPYSTGQRVKKAERKGKDRLDILPNKHSVWLKQVRSSSTTGRDAPLFLVFAKSSE